MTTFFTGHRVLSALILAALFAWSSVATAQIITLDSFDPSDSGGLCSVAFDQTTGSVWVYDCNDGMIDRYSVSGTFLGSVPRPGESANDVEVEIAPEAINLNGTVVPEGTLLFINGETGSAEIYALDKNTGAILATLNTAFGNSHVVGGGYSSIRNTFFLVQDRQTTAENDNRVAEIDPVTGAVLNSFQTTGIFSVNFGDLDVSNQTGNLFIVSSDELGLGEFTPSGDFVQSHPLPGTASLSGIALDCAQGEAWVSGTAGLVTHIGDVPCGANTPPVALAATATSPLSVVPGGSISFDYTVTNTTGSTVTGNLGFVALRSGNQVASGTIQSGSIIPGQAVSSSFTQSIPNFAPPGPYTYELRVGQFSVPVDTESFSVFVNATAQAGEAESWSVIHAAPWPSTEDAASRVSADGVAAYPNPFDRQTEITFSLDQSSEVRLAVYDVRGREVAQLTEGTYQAGSHTVTFDGTDLPSGVYVWRLEAGDEVQTGRLALVR